MKLKNKNSKNRFSAGFRRKGDRDSFNILYKNNNFKNERNSIAYNQKYTPISILFKNEPISFELIQSLIKLNEINIDNNIENYNEEMQEKYLKDLIKKIVKLIKFHKGLYNFISYNKIDDKLLTKIIPKLQFQQREKNFIIWEENDNSTQVYFLLKGKIIFKKKNNSGEKEKHIQNENNIFGMFDVIYERKRKLSCLCATECCYLSIDKEFFKKNIEEKISRIESEKKSFLVRFFNKYIIIPLIKLERFLMKYVEILFFGKNDVIFQKGDLNKSLYLIFNGEANLMANINEGEFFILPKSNQSISHLQEMAKNIDYINIIKKEDNIEKKNNNNNKIEYLDFLLEKANYEVISTLSKGCVGGLEITTGMTKFKYTLISNTNFCAILKLNIEHLEDEHLKMLLINLLPDFINSEKKIHHQIKNIKYIDNNIIPPSCQKYKDMLSLINNTHNINNIELKNQNIHDSKNSNNNYINLNITDNEDNKTYEKIIQTINDKFDKNEGGFINMNNFNINLCKKKYFLKEKIKNSKRNDNTINNFIRKYKEGNLNNLKNSSFKMNYLLNENTIKSTNLYESILSKKLNNNQKCYKKSNSKSEMKTWNFPSPESNLSKNKNLFNMNMNFIKKGKKNIRANSTKITKKKYFNRLNEIFENYYKRKYLHKDYSKRNDDNNNDDHKLISVQLIMNSFRKNRNINLFKKKNNFIKEIIYMKESLSKDEKIKSNTLIYDSSDRMDNIETINTLPTYYRENKKFSKFNTINEFDFNENNFDNNKDSERVIKIINNKYIRDLFYMNSNNHNRFKFKDKRNILFNKFKDEKNIKNRIIFYDTGHFDMPLATNLPKFG